MYRLTDSELEQLAGDLESDRVERTRSFSKDTPDKLRRAICAFANDLPGHKSAGVFFIGVADDGTPAPDFMVTDELLKTLGATRSDGQILPPPVLTVEKRQVQGKDVAVVTVQPSDSPPVQYAGRIHIRVGPRRGIAHRQEERLLTERRRSRSLPFDVHPVSSSTLKDLSRALFENEYLPAAFAPDIVEANGRTYSERLASLRLASSPDDDAIPTVIGLLAIGKSPQDFLPGAYVQFLRIDGASLTDPVIDAEEFRGTLAGSLRRCEEKLQSHNRSAVDVTSGSTHAVSFTYPPVAIQQMLYNAVLHRTYEGTNAPVRVHWFSNRTEISSPGGPYGNVTVDNFGKPGITDYRNPNIAAYMKICGFIQAFGRGISLAREAMQKHGNPEPHFEVDQNLVLVTLHKAEHL